MYHEHYVDRYLEATPAFELDTVVHNNVSRDVHTVAPQVRAFVLSWSSVHQPPQLVFLLDATQAICSGNADGHATYCFSNVI